MCKTKIFGWIILVVILSNTILSGCQSGCSEFEGNTKTNAYISGKPSKEIIQLPDPKLAGEMSLEEAIKYRRSFREFKDEPLDADEISQLLWAAQGITDPAGYRTSPSAGALYPLEIYLLTQEGIYQYHPDGHVLYIHQRGDYRRSLYSVALEQEAILSAPVVFIITAVYERTSVKYGKERSPRYVHMEAGHAAQNLLLQATVLGLGAVPIGAFYDEELMEALSLPMDHEPLYLIPVGRLGINGQ